jgi:hypothetical protein
MCGISRAWLCVRSCRTCWTRTVCCRCSCRQPWRRSANHTRAHGRSQPCFPALRTQHARGGTKGDQPSGTHLILYRQSLGGVGESGVAGNREPHGSLDLGISVGLVGGRVCGLLQGPGDSSGGGRRQGQQACEDVETHLVCLFVNTGERMCALSGRSG